MDQATHNKIVSFIWGIADDVLRDLFKRGKYPDVILPMCVLRRMDVVLEPTKKQVLEELVRKFNEENNEEAGEHWPPRDAVRLMARLVFLPIEKDIKSGTTPRQLPAAAVPCGRIRDAA